MNMLPLSRPVVGQQITKQQLSGAFAPWCNTPADISLERWVLEHWALNKIIITTALLLLGPLGQSLCFAEAEKGNSSASSGFEMTVHRFFESQADYQDGDLITRSHVEELNLYLRRTRQYGQAHRSLMHQRFLPGNSRLSRLFYLKNEGNVLRLAAQKLGGYAALEAATRPTTNFTLLTKAVDSGSVDAVLELLKSSGFDQRPESEKTEGKKKPQRKTIYTVEELLNAISAAPKSKTPANES